MKLKVAGAVILVLFVLGLVFFGRPDSEPTVSHEPLPDGVRVAIERIEELDNVRFGGLSIEGGRVSITYRDEMDWWEDDWRDYLGEWERMAGSDIPAKAVPASDLRLRSFIRQITALDCPREQQSGTITVTHTGAIIHQAACYDREAENPYVLRGARIDGVEAQPLRGWEASDIDAALHTLRSITGDEVSALNFVFEHGIDEFDGVVLTTTARASSTSMSCHVNTSLGGIEVGQVTYGHCTTPYGDEDPPFLLSDVPGARIVEGLQRGLNELDVELDDLAFIAIRNTRTGPEIHLRVSYDQSGGFWSGELR